MLCTSWTASRRLAPTMRWSPRIWNAGWNGGAQSASPSIQPESTHRGFRLVLFLGVASKAQVRDAVDVIVAAEMLGRTGLKCAGRGECPAMPFKGRDELLPATSFASLNGCGKNELGMPFTRGTISARPSRPLLENLVSIAQGLYESIAESVFVGSDAERLWCVQGTARPCNERHFTRQR